MAQGITFALVEENRADITLDQGKTISFDYVWGGDSPIDVTGFDAKLCIKKDYTAQSTADFTVANNRVSIGDVNGVIRFTMNAADSAALPAPFSGVYEIEITDASGAVYKGLYGECVIRPEVCS